MKINKIDEKSLVKTLYILKEMEMEEPDDQEDEYLDAFVALGGSADKEGRIEAKLLIEIIKDDFELTINMQEYLNSVESSDSLDFYQF
jgi:calmodulin